MTTNEGAEAAREARLQEALMALLEPGEQDAALDRQALLARYPDLAAELSEFLAGHDLIGGIAAMVRKDLAATFDGRAGLPPEAAGEIQRLGDYQIESLIGEGGMGKVYKARQIGLNRIVALKTIRTGLFAGPDERRRFDDEAKLAAALKHPNIVAIHEVGQHQGLAYFSMDYIEGQSLAAIVKDHPLPPKQAAVYLKQIARAIQFAHDQRVLHRDLKPSNVLIDASGQVHVTDFGLATRVGEDSQLTVTGAPLGTPSYCPPEQASGKKSDIGERSDVYSMGAILYDLLTGHPPFQGVTPQDTLLLVRDADPIPPRRQNPGIPRDLETICLTCLSKEPDQRYGSARALAEDLELYLGGQPIKARPVGVGARLHGWCKRHPLAAGVIATAIALTVMVVAATASSAQTLKGRLRDEVLESNTYAARNVAGAVRGQLSRWSRPVESIAQEPELRSLLRDGGPRERIQEILEQQSRFYQDPANGFLTPGERSPFSNMHILGANGIALARAPDPADYPGKYLGERDYFRGALESGARRSGSPVHISRVYKSVTDDLYKFAISAPIRADGRPDAPIVGVVVATIASDSTLGLPQLHDHTRKAALVSLEDPTSAAGAPGHVIIVHPAYGRPGERAEVIHNPQLLALDERPRSAGARDQRALEPGGAQAATTDSDYRDPVYGGHDRWLAAFERVADTHFIVIVQQRYEDAIGVEGILAREIVIWVIVALGVGATVMAAAAWYARRRARAQ